MAADEKLTFDGQALRLAELDAIYVEDADRFVVSLISTYGNSDDKITDPEDAALALLNLATDDGAGGTHWVVYDRHTGTTHHVELGDRVWTDSPVGPDL